MKTDRLYALTLYLLNHGKSSASELAKHFEVSVRTIQRDIDALCQAGIPICAFTGTNGGYEILSDFKSKRLIFRYDRKNPRLLFREYPKVCVNLQTDVR